eukprot:CAMPEP_0169444564 /NCGR_PEP_ID=MMETSP1042-20121227/9965_1 /TAXON_ID=464988 /ORGANISM="Hemiselmis andersenii, Strain CCMP1180" /LENGTH=495 /DNA_ID=CAMNT_0009555885 /DNA_START=124 /DNA_END=1607 /DNA_ORIENTATION=+
MSGIKRESFKAKYGGEDSTHQDSNGVAGAMGQKRGRLAGAGAENMLRLQPSIVVPSQEAKGGKLHMSAGQHELEERTFWISQRRSACATTSFFSFLGVCIAIAQNEILWRAQQEVWNPSVYAIVLKISTVVTTIIAIIYMLKYYESIVALKRLSGVLLPPGLSINSLRGAGVINKLAMDVLFLIPQPLPFIDFDVHVWDQGLGRESVYNLDTLLLCLMFCRASFLPRLYGECISDLSSETATAIGRLNKLTIDSTFIMKYVIANSLQVVSVLFFIQIMIFSYLMMCAERPTDNGALRHYANCLWLVIITMTTVGYGDEYPSTMLGRIVSVLASLSAVIMLAIVINLVVSKLSLSRQEGKVLDVMDNIQLRKDLKQSAALVLQRWFRTHLKYYKEVTKQAPAAARSGYERIPEFVPMGIKTRGKRIAHLVLSDVNVLEAINAFQEIQQQKFANELAVDVTELVGSLGSKLFAQERKVQALAEQAVRLNKLAMQLAG